MSKGIVHSLATTVMAVEFAAVAAITLSPVDLQYSMGAVLGLIVQPDLDVDHGKTIVLKYVGKFGKLPVFIWNIVWWPYRKSFKHGSFLSHFPVISTLVREAYIFFVFVVIPYVVIAPVLHLDVRSELYWWIQHIMDHYRVTLGLMSTDLIHWILDVCTKERRPKWKTSVNSYATKFNRKSS